MLLPRSKTCSNGKTFRENILISDDVMLVLFIPESTLWGGYVNRNNKLARAKETFHEVTHTATRRVPKVDVM